MKRTKLIFLLFLFTIVFFSYQKAAVCTASVNGNWGDASTWSCGSVPACGDSVVIPSGFTVTVAATINYTSTCGMNGSRIAINVFGVLKFGNSQRMALPCKSAVYLQTGAKLLKGTGGGNNNFINICGDEVWDASDGDKTGPLVFLPIELLYFDAEICNQQEVCLNWATATEKNNEYFTVERSINGQEFVSVIQIPGKGNSYSTQTYNTSDKAPVKGLSYYRLKQTDTDGSFSYSNIIPINFDFAVWTQNPVSGYNIPVFIAGSKSDPLTIKFIDVLGRVCFSEKIILTFTGTNNYVFNLAGRLSGNVAYLVISNDFKSAKVKVIID